MLLYLDTLFWLWTNTRSLLIFTNAACFCRGETAITNFIVLGLIRPVIEPKIYHTWGKHVNNYMTVTIYMFHTIHFQLRIKLYGYWLTTLYSPNTTCLASKKSHFVDVIKNWHPLLSFPLLALKNMKLHACRTAYCQFYK